MPAGEPSAAEIREHFEIERELAAKLRAAGSREERRDLYGRVYRERSERIAKHPLVIEANDPVARAASVAPQVELLRPFLHPSSAYLELGAGDGAVTRAVAPFVGSAVGLDVTDALFASSDGEAFELRVFDGFELGVEPATVDVAYSNDVAEHLHPDDMREQSAAVHRTLVPGGIYVCVTPNRLSGPHDVSRHFSKTPEGFHLCEYTASELAATFRSIGFRRVRVFLSRHGRHLSPRLPASVVWPLEAAIEKLPAPLRHSVAPGLHAIKVVAVR